MEDSPCKIHIRALQTGDHAWAFPVSPGASCCAGGAAGAETDLTALNQHLELLGESVWSHVLLLFTFGDWLGSTPVEQFIESEGDALQELVDRCGNRYHLFNNKQRDDETQVTELLEKIEEMVQENGGRHFEMDEKKVDEVKEMRRICVEEGEKRWKRRSFKSLDSGISSVLGSSESMRSDLTVCTESSESLDSGDNYLCRSRELLVQFQLVLMGYRRAGQTSSANTILGLEEFGYSCLRECVRRSSEGSNCSVSVICTPGWEKTEKCYNTPDQNLEIVRSVERCSPGPCVFLLVLRASMSFCAETLKAMEEHVELLGEGVWDHTMLLFMYGDRLGDATIEQHIESEGEALKKLVERCGNRYHVLDNYNRVGRSQVTSLLKKIKEMVTANGEHCFEVNKEKFEEAKRKWTTEAARGERKREDRWREDKELGEHMGPIERSFGLKTRVTNWWKKTSSRGTSAQHKSQMAQQ